MTWKELVKDNKIELYEACFDAKYKALTEKEDHYVMLYNDGTVSVQRIFDLESQCDGSGKLIYEASKDSSEIDDIRTVEELNEVCMKQNDYFVNVINEVIDEFSKYDYNY